MAEETTTPAPVETPVEETAPVAEATEKKSFFSFCGCFGKSTAAVEEKPVEAASDATTDEKVEEKEA